MMTLFDDKNVYLGVKKSPNFVGSAVIKVNNYEKEAFQYFQPLKILTRSLHSTIILIQIKMPLN